MEKKEVGNKRIVTILKTLLVSYVVTGIILLVLALLLYKLDLPKQALSIGVIVAYLVSTFVGGLIIGKTTNHKRFLWGLILGIGYFVVILIISIILNKGIMGSLGTMVMSFLLCSLGGMFGGMVS